MKLLLGVSGDEGSRTALERTVDRVRETGDELTVAVVDRRGSFRDSGTVLAEVREVLSDADVDAEVVRLDDDAAGLVDLAEEGGFDRIVVGGGAESPMGKVELDRLEQYVLLNAKTTVTIVR